MASYQVLYWNEFPAQVKAEEGGDEVNLELNPRMQELIDAEATQRGVIGSDEYLDGWHWSDPEDRPGGAQQVAEAIKAELEAKFL